MVPLHKVATGLLQLLQAATLGRNPSEFGTTVQPTLDVTEFYAAPNKVISVSAPTVGALQGLFDVLVFTGPNRIHAIGGRLIIGAAAATNVTVCVGLRNGTTGERIGIASHFFAQLPAASDVDVGAIVHPMVIPPSAAVGGEWSAFALVNGTAAGVDHSVSARILIDNITSSA